VLIYPLTTANPDVSPMHAKKPKQSADDYKCAVCRGTGVIVLSNPAAPEIRQPPVCPRCGGTGRALLGSAKRYGAPHQTPWATPSRRSRRAPEAPPVNVDHSVSNMRDRLGSEIAAEHPSADRS
jgi:hypothetical protein